MGENGEVLVVLGWGGDDSWRRWWWGMWNIPCVHPCACPLLTSSLVSLIVFIPGLARVLLPTIVSSLVFFSGSDHVPQITGLFYGMFRSEVKKSGNAKSSVTREPFHCLQVRTEKHSHSKIVLGDRHTRYR